MCEGIKRVEKSLRAVGYYSTGAGADTKQVWFCAPVSKLRGRADASGSRLRGFRAEFRAWDVGWCVIWAEKTEWEWSGRVVTGDAPYDGRR